MEEVKEVDDQRIPVVADYANGESFLVISINGKPVPNSQYAVSGNGVLTLDSEFFSVRDYE